MVWKWPSWFTTIKVIESTWNRFFIRQVATVRTLHLCLVSGCGVGKSKSQSERSTGGSSSRWDFYIFKKWTLGQHRFKYAVEKKCSTMAFLNRCIPWCEYNQTALLWLIVSWVLVRDLVHWLPWQVVDMSIRQSFLYHTHSRLNSRLNTPTFACVHIQVTTPTAKELCRVMLFTWSTRYHSILVSSWFLLLLFHTTTSVTNTW